MATHDSVLDTGRHDGQRRRLFSKPAMLADYRKINGSTSNNHPTAGNVIWLGLLYNQWLANVLLAMGVPPREFELWGHKGTVSAAHQRDVDPALRQALREHHRPLFPDGEHGTALSEGLRTHAAIRERFR